MKIQLKISRFFVLFFCSYLYFNSNFVLAQTAEKYLQNKTVTYDEAISFYRTLNKKYQHNKLIEAGNTDCGKPLHLFIISNDDDFEPASIKAKNKIVLFVNNGIHAGEPCGVDASLGFAQDLLSKSAMQQLLQYVVVCIIPFYNIDGGLNRGCCSRANQNGPDEYGFRGNSRNLDLNRDMVKCDAFNTRSLIELYQKWKPEIFIDTHISDGADYSYTMTLIATQHNKLSPILGEYLNAKMLPQLYESMKLKNQEMCPYVDTYKATPDSGIVAFLETARFTTGYTALFNTIGFVTESHMLKPYPEQVKATYQVLQSILEIADKDHSEIRNLKMKADEMAAKEKSYYFKWALDTGKVEQLSFKGYTSGYKKSSISGLNRLYYDRSKPYEKKIKYYNSYRSHENVSVPKAFIVSQAWHQTIDLLKLNGVKISFLNSDTNINVTATYIDDYKTTSKPYEGHYLHSNVKVRNEQQNLSFHKGDVMVICGQPANKFIMEVLEPRTEDSYFNWNFFDSAMQQKEWFSDYVYEEKAEEVLKNDPALKIELENYIKQNHFENNQWEYLSWIYKHSKEFERSAMCYPVYRIE